ncbi:hypothetical protein [Devosia sp.]|uniref:hypothetical protein n=1 Tax=Devosia sp. TaxID=1871048 RepID=UPI00326739D5
MKTLLGALALALLATAAALAKDATCYTTVDGEYPCVFKATANDGSFMISGRGKPTFYLNMDTPGVAFGAADFGGEGHTTNLPGTYTRSEDDPACWENSDTDTEICAW